MVRRGIGATVYPIRMAFRRDLAVDRCVSVYCTAMEREVRSTGTALRLFSGGTALLKMLRVHHGKTILVGAGVLLLMSTASPVDAYVGPGAGFALLGSFFVIFATMILAGVSLLILPFRTVWRIIKRRTKVKPLAPRVIVVGFDGQDTRLTEKFMGRGQDAQFLPIGGKRLLQQTPNDVPFDYSGRMVIFFDWRQSRKTQYLRFPRPGSSHLPSSPFLCLHWVS